MIGEIIIHLQYRQEEYTIKIPHRGMIFEKSSLYEGFLYLGSNYTEKQNIVL